MAKDRRPYNRKVTVYQQSTSTAANTDGSFDETEAVYCTRRCRAWPNSGRETGAMEHQHALVEWTVILRYDAKTAAITPAMWMDLRDGTRLNVVSVYDSWKNGRQREIEIKATQKV